VSDLTADGFWIIVKFVSEVTDSELCMPNMNAVVSFLTKWEHGKQIKVEEKRASEAGESSGGIAKGR